MNKREPASSGIGFSGALTILFIGLKLAGIIKWSWVWVLSPLWITTIVVFSVIALMIVFLSR